MVSLAQSANCFTTDELKLIHKQQLRLVYCDSSKVLLIESQKVCNSLVKKQEERINVINQQCLATSKMAETYRLSYEQQKTQIKGLKRKNMFLKIGIVGVGSIASSFILFQCVTN